MAKTMVYGHFTTLVAKDRVVRQFGGQTKNWPPENFWAIVSSYRSSIQTEQIPTLMEQYGIHQLINCPQEVLDEYQ